MAISAATAEKLAAYTNLVIGTDAGYASATVQTLVKIVKHHGRHITIHAGRYSAASLETFAQLGGSNVTIVL